jgi:bifunctional lysine-specific demethylase and histidyl-hydroxylase NO66
MPTTTPPTPEPRRASAALSRCVGDPGAFLAGAFTRTPHTFQGEAFDDLLSLADVDAQVTGAGLRRPAVRLVRAGEVLDPATWTRRARTGRTWVDDLVDPARALALFADGATIVLQSLHRWWPPLTRFCTDLEIELDHPVQANAYLTPPGSTGLTPHHDTHDVFVLQVAGTKHWTVREPVVEAPLGRHRSDHEQAAGQPVSFEVDLGPGDCLYLPRGTVHSAAAQQGTSLHLTIGVLATTAHDVLRRLVDRAADDITFRRSLPIGHRSDPEVAVATLKGVVDDLVGWLEDLDLEEAATDLVVRPGDRRRPTLGGHLLDLVGLEEIGDATTVCLRSMPALEVVDGRLRLELGDRTLDLPGRLEPAVRLLVGGTPVQVGALAGHLDGPSRLVLVRRLVREGLLRIADGP